jgi:hypothetical protein
VNADMLEASLTAWANRPYKRFFDQWVYGAGHPVLDVRYRYDAIAESLYVDVRQTQEGYLVHGAFDLDLTIEAFMLGGTQRFTYAMRDTQARAAFPLALAPRFLVVDPDHRYLMETTVDQSLTAWVAQLRFAPNEIDRLKAVEALRRSATDPALVVGLQPALQSDPPESVYAAIVSLLAALPASETVDRLLLQAFDEESPRIKTAVLEGWAERKDTGDLAVLALETAESAESYTLQAEAVTTLAHIEAPGAETIVRSALITPSHREQVRLAGLAAIPRVGIATREGVSMAIAHTGARHGMEVRLGAIDLLAYYARLGNKTAANALSDLAGDPIPLLRAAAQAALQAPTPALDPHHVARTMGTLRLAARLTP